MTTYFNKPGILSDVSLLASPEWEWESKYVAGEEIRRDLELKALFIPEGETTPMFAIQLPIVGGTISNPKLIGFEALTEEGELNLYVANPRTATHPDGKRVFLQPAIKEGHYVPEVAESEEQLRGRKYPVELLPFLVQVGWDLKALTVGAPVAVRYRKDHPTHAGQQVLHKGLPLYEAGPKYGFQLCLETLLPRSRALDVRMGAPGAEVAPAGVKYHNGGAVPK